MLHIFLDHQREAFQKLQTFESFFKKNHYYLIGGTALALQIGHRRSIDFDFITKRPVDPKKLRLLLQSEFSPLVITQMEKNTLTVLWEDVQFSFFGEISRPLLKPLVQFQHLNLLSPLDIGAMKVRTLLDRSVLKDYFDLAFLLQFEGFTIKMLMDAFYKKYGSDASVFSPGLIYRYFGDLVPVIDQNIDILMYQDFWRKGRLKTVIASIMAKKGKEYLEKK